MSSPFFASSPRTVFAFSSLKELRALYKYVSSSLRASIVSTFALSSSANFSASSTIRSTCAFDKRPLSFVMVILFDLPELFSAADTFRIPFASRSYEISICGIPRGIGGIPSKRNVPKRLLSFVKLRSPS